MNLLNARIGNSSLYELVSKQREYALAKKYWTRVTVPVDAGCSASILELSGIVCLELPKSLERVIFVPQKQNRR